MSSRRIAALQIVPANEWELSRVEGELERELRLARLLHACGGDRRQLRRVERVLEAGLALDAGLR
jgi:hypothetical protein